MIFEALTTRGPQCDLKWESRDICYKMEWHTPWYTFIKIPDSETPRVNHLPHLSGIRPSHCHSFTFCLLFRKTTLSLTRHHLNTQTHRGISRSDLMNDSETIDAVEVHWPLEASWSPNTYVYWYCISMLSLYLCLKCISSDTIDFHSPTQAHCAPNIKQDSAGTAGSLHAVPSAGATWSTGWGEGENTGGRRQKPVQKPIWYNLMSFDVIWCHVNLQISV